MAFQLEIAEVIEEAFELIGMESRTGYDLVRARRSLNIMLADWANRGVNLWKVERVDTPLVANQDVIPLTEDDIDIIDAAILYKSQYYTLHRTVRADYLTIPNKEQTGRPSEYYVERTIIPSAYIWPVPVDNDYTFVGYYIKNLTTLGAVTENPDIPSRFLYPLVLGLAFQLALKVAPERAEVMQILYEEAFAKAANEDSERGSMYIFPGRC